MKGLTNACSIAGRTAAATTYVSLGCNKRACLWEELTVGSMDSSWKKRYCITKTVTSDLPYTDTHTHTPTMSLCS